MHFDKFNIEDLEFPMNVKNIPKLEILNTQSAFGIGLRTEGALHINVFELTGTVLTPIHINTNSDQPQIDLLLYENHYCLITKLHCLINKSSHMKHVCRRCLTAFSSEPVLLDHLKKYINQKPTNISFSWKDHLKFENLKITIGKFLYQKGYMQVLNLLINLKIQQSWLHLPKALCVIPKYYLNKLQL